MTKTNKKDGKTSPALKAALNFLGRRQFGVQELQDRLKRRGFSDEEIGSAVDKLLFWGYLDDEAFARDALTSAMRKNPMGKFLAVQKLRRFGLSDEIVQETVDNAYGDLAEQELASEAIIRYLNGKDQSSLIDKDRARLYRWLLSRGFDHSVVYPLIFSE